MDVTRTEWDVHFENVQVTEGSVNASVVPTTNNVDTTEMTYTITADRSIWGKNTYYAWPLVDGKPVKDQKGNGKIGFWAFTKENFSHLTQDQKSKGPRPTFKESTYSFGKVKAGQKVKASYTFKKSIHAICSIRCASPLIPGSALIISRNRFTNEEMFDIVYSLIYFYAAYNADSNSLIAE